MYQAGKGNRNADALSECPLGEQPADPILDDTQVAAIQTSAKKLLAVGPKYVAGSDEFPREQQKDPDVQEIIAFSPLENYQTVIRGPRGWPHHLHK